MCAPTYVVLFVDSVSPVGMRDTLGSKKTKHLQGLDHACWRMHVQTYMHACIVTKDKTGLGVDGGEQARS